MLFPFVGVFESVFLSRKTDDLEPELPRHLVLCSWFIVVVVFPCRQRMCVTVFGCFGLSAGLLGLFSLIKLVKMNLLLM